LVLGKGQHMLHQYLAATHVRCHMQDYKFGAVCAVYAHQMQNL